MTCKETCFLFPLGLTCADNKQGDMVTINNLIYSTNTETQHHMPHSGYMVKGSLPAISMFLPIDGIKHIFHVTNTGS